MRAMKLAVFAYAVALIAAVGAPASGAKPLDGKTIFRFDTFGDEQFWTDTLQMQTPVSTLTPRQALSVGLKVDADALPPTLVAALKAGEVDLDDPAVTMELLKLNAVVGVIGKVADSKVRSVGVTCAICHSTVDDSVTTGIGTRLDGWPNRTLNVGAIVALSPEPVYATRSATGAYRTTPLRALWQHPPYFHDGSAPDLLAVVNHYDALFSLGLSDKQKADLVEFLKSL